MNYYHPKKKTLLQAWGDIIRCFTEKEESNQECGCGAVNPSAIAYHGCGCGVVEQPAPEYHGCGCGVVEQPAPEYHGCGCGVVEQPAPEYHGCGCGVVEQPAPEYHGCGCGVVEQPAPEYHGCGCGVETTDFSFDSRDMISMAGLKPGETVLEIGSRGGTDCFEAARRVGPAGKVIGLDMTPQMIELARNNTKKLGFVNVEFNQGEMKSIPLPDNSVDIIIDNCIVNPGPSDLDNVFAEAFRVLKPAGRINLSSVVVRGNLSKYEPNLPGAISEQEYLAKICATGFENVEIISKTTLQAQSPNDKLMTIGVRAFKPV